MALYRTIHKKYTHSAITSKFHSYLDWNDIKIQKKPTLSNLQTLHFHFQDVKVFRFQVSLTVHLNLLPNVKGTFTASHWVLTAPGSPLLPRAWCTGSSKAAQVLTPQCMFYTTNRSNYLYDSLYQHLVWEWTGLSTAEPPDKTALPPTVVC